MKSSLTQIIDRLNNKPLPGEIAHKEMSTVCRDISLRKKYLKVKKAAVLFLLFESENQVYFPLIQRALYSGIHSGEVGLPGGKIEKFDKNSAATALREAEEELGVDSSEIKIIRSLTSLYIPTSDFSVTPYIGIFPGQMNYLPNPTEVEDIFNLSLYQLSDPQNQIKVWKNKRNIRLMNPAFRFGKHVVWGATACMLNEFKYLLNK